MRGLILIAAAAALLGACDSSGCGGPPEKQSSGESASMSGGGGSHGGLGEAVSFQGIGKKQDPPPANGTGQPQQAAGAGSPAAQAAAAPAAQASAQSVICGGFPGLPADCSKAPEFDAIKKKCCPTGQVQACQGIPGGARLIGQGCTAAAK
ncbi:MAG: hypothetical protein HY079_13495 [Elusimicrobia bacterium]|nr:hypothetical protein [Elusimicrobiota bacterium]